MITRALLRVTAALGATLLAACGDTSIPTAASPSQTLRIETPSFHLRGTNVPFHYRGDTVFASFTVKPAKAETFVFDRTHAIKFPAAGICEPLTSSYGLGTWDEPCEPTTRDIVVTVQAYYNAAGVLNVDFQPALRFNPTTSGVFLYLDDRKWSNTGRGEPIDPWLKTIVYCPDAWTCIDESLTDPTLRTYYDAKTNLHSRRIKHFSGYTFGVGFHADDLGAY